MISSRPPNWQINSSFGSTDWEKILDKISEAAPTCALLTIQLEWQILEMSMLVEMWVEGLSIEMHRKIKVLSGLSEDLEFALEADLEQNYSR